MVTGCKHTKTEENLEVDQTLYISIIGSLFYLIALIPYIMYHVSIFGIFQASPRQIHLLAAKRIGKYLRETMDHGL